VPPVLPPPRVVVADDDPLLRGLLADLLAREGFAVVGEAADGAEAVRLVAELRPDVVTMDLEMPRMNGVEAIREIARLPGAPPVLVVSGSASSELVDEALAAGAVGRLSKARLEAELGDALRAAVAARAAA